MATAKPLIVPVQVRTQSRFETPRLTVRRVDVFFLLTAFVLYAFVIAAFSLTAANMLRLAGIGLGLFLVLVILKYRLLPPPEALLYLLWTIWSSLSYCGAENTDAFLLRYRVVLQMNVLLLGVSTITRYLGAPTIPLIAIVTGAFISAGYSFVTGEFNGPTSSSDERVSGLLDNANGFGYQMLLALMAVTLLWGIARNQWYRFLLAVVYPVLVAALISSGSRKNFLGFILFIIWIVFTINKRRQIKLRPLVISIATLAGVVLLYNFSMEKTIIGRRFHREFDEFSSNEIRDLDRYEYYAIGLDLIAKSPIIGIGFGNFQFRNSYGQDSHSDYMEVASSTGIFGALIYFAIYVVLWRRLGKIKQLAPDYGHFIDYSKASVLATLFVSLGMPQLSSTIHWCFIGVLSGFAHYHLGILRVNACPKRLCPSELASCRESSSTLVDSTAK